MTGFTRRLRRRTESTRFNRGKNTPIVIEIPAGGRVVGFRLSKTRRTYYLPTAELLGMAIRVHMDSEKARKKAERKAKRT